MLRSLRVCCCSWEGPAQLSSLKSVGRWAGGQVMSGNWGLPQQCCAYNPNPITFYVGLSIPSPLSNQVSLSITHQMPWYLPGPNGHCSPSPYSAPLNTPSGPDRASASPQPSPAQPSPGGGSRTVACCQVGTFPNTECVLSLCLSAFLLISIHNCQLPFNTRKDKNLKGICHGPSACSITTSCLPCPLPHLLSAISTLTRCQTWCPLILCYGFLKLWAKIHHGLHEIKFLRPSVTMMKSWAIHPRSFAGSHRGNLLIVTWWRGGSSEIHRKKKTCYGNH